MFIARNGSKIRAGSEFIGTAGTTTLSAGAVTGLTCADHRDADTDGGIGGGDCAAGSTTFTKTAI